MLQVNLNNHTSELSIERDIGLFFWLDDRTFTQESFQKQVYS